MIKKITIFIILMSFISCAGFAWGDEIVKVGYWESPGMLNGAGPDQRKSGYAYDLLQVIASHAGFKYEYVYGEFSDLYDKLLDGKIDILPTVCKTEERKSKILFPKV